MAHFVSRVDTLVGGEVTMPYIEPELRILIDKEIEILGNEIGAYGELREKKDGVLNYVITCLVRKLYKTSYTELNAAIGVLECAKLELYRRRLALYEDEAKERNGDVY